MDADLGAQLHELFQQGHDEVTVVHPAEGEVTITKSEFYGHISDLQKSMAPLSPADRIIEKNRLERLKNYRQMQFRTKMIEAEVHQVDLNGDDNYGFDAKGNKIGIEGMEFVPIHNYLEGIVLHDHEVGAFIDQSGKKYPIRITSI